MNDIMRQINANTDDNNNKNSNDDVDDHINTSFSYDAKLEMVYFKSMQNQVLR